MLQIQTAPILAGIRTLLSSRGYTNIKTKALEDIPEMKFIHDSYYFTADKVNQEKIHCIVQPDYQKTMNKQQALQCIQYFKAHGETTHLVLITNNLTFQALELFLKSGLDFESLKLQEVTFDKMGHHLVPVYTILEERQVLALEQQYCTSRHHFPRLSFDDAICRYMGFRKGAVVEVKHKSVFRNITYRIIR